MSNIFLNYRREDSAPYAGRLYDRLSAHFGESRVFMDIDNIDLGEDFEEVLTSKVAVCDVLIAVIGKNWLAVTDKQGRRRLGLDGDWVRMEIAAALQRKIKVIPVLVGGATMPDKSELPPSLLSMATRHALELDDARFHQDVDALIRAIEKTLGRTPATAGGASTSKSQSPERPARPSLHPSGALRPTSDESLVILPELPERPYGDIFVRSMPDARGPGSDLGTAGGAEDDPATKHVAQGVAGRGIEPSDIGRAAREAAPAGGFTTRDAVLVLLSMVLGYLVPLLVFWALNHSFRTVGMALLLSVVLGILPTVGAQWAMLRKDPSLARTWLLMVSGAWLVGDVGGAAFSGFQVFAFGSVAGCLAAGIVLSKAHRSARGTRGG